MTATKYLLVIIQQISNYMNSIFDEIHEKELQKYRKEFFNNYIDQEPKTCNQSPTQSRLEKNKFSLSLSNLQTQRSLVQSSARKSQHERRRVVNRQSQQIITNNNNVNYEFSFPKWILEKNDLKKWKSHSDFDINLKIISICKTETFKRDAAQKQIVALYLQKLSLFKLMPLMLLQELAGRLTYKEIKSESDLTLCKVGDEGNFIYIIFQGTVKVLIKDICVKEFHDNEHLGRQALEADAPRNATLICTQNAHILIVFCFIFQELNFKIFLMWMIKKDSENYFFNFITTSYDQLMEMVKQQDEKKKLKYKTIKDALIEGLQNVDQLQLQKKTKKYKGILKMPGVD
ncbi:unnamed protein product [Paramecium pentaurelia]|uniref:Cyclic nucleotide-binding domain-containing protein n=1 Tax=Paramecium pentaurelia TaxID=43138 RepID=A0A8S1YFI4_9CILI|nr:unnamed protein product [Paramecium pentaurelia]